MYDLFFGTSRPFAWCLTLTKNMCFLLSLSGMCCVEILMLKNRARPRKNLLTQLIIFYNEDVISACGSGKYVLWFNFIFGLNFISLCFGVW